MMTRVLYTDAAGVQRLWVQASLRQFWFGFTFEHGAYLFIGFGPFTLSLFTRPGYP